MTKTLLRSAIAAIIGIVVAFGVIWLAQYAGSEISPDVYDPNSGEILIPVGSTIALIVGWFVGTFGGGWLAMRVSAGTGPGWVVAGAVIGAVECRAVTLADSWWIMALGVAVPLLAVWLAQRATTIVIE